MEEAGRGYAVWLMWVWQAALDYAERRIAALRYAAEKRV